MRAAVLHAPNTPLAVEERPVPEPGPGELLIRVVACGMCFSEVNHLRGHYPFGAFPVVPGHEVSGVVEALGPGVDFPAAGTRVGVPFLYDSCGHCDHCVRGDQILCPDKRATGVGVDGGYANYMIAKAGYATPIPESLDPVAAAPLMCAGITGFNGLRHAGVRPGSKVAVLGTGGVGTMTARFAVAMGARVAVVSRNGRGADHAKALGAELFVATGEQDPAAALRGWDGGADVVVNTAPSTAAAEAAMGGIAPDGTLLMLGFDPSPLRVSPMHLVVNRARVMGMPSGSPHDLRDTLAFAAAHGILPEVEPVSLDEAPAVLAAMADGTAPGGRHVITP
ncbi:alcohol dehydrogenase catalytic domain-containing protein [Thermoactinospora rubra]|uniref:alcohol dehydrogenase catalytic domain-containing protein n=1 Tax=Thermoactinospora rubra TaxID=1088767 RepID=UPI000A0FA9E7|nr:alcohol dehydrogenase catalytic domain-containing protein [Thermoactinospora rubra]